MKSVRPPPGYEKGSQKIFFFTIDGFPKFCFKFSNYNIIPNDHSSIGVCDDFNERAANKSFNSLTMKSLCW